MIITLLAIFVLAIALYIIPFLLGWKLAKSKFEHVLASLMGAGFIVLIIKKIFNL